MRDRQFQSVDSGNVPGRDWLMFSCCLISTKVWAFPLGQMNVSWVGERRVAVTKKFYGSGRGMIWPKQGKDDIYLGTEQGFQFPRRGGTERAIWRACALARRLPQPKLVYNASIAWVDLDRHEVVTTDGRMFCYDEIDLNPAAQ